MTEEEIIRKFARAWASIDGKAEKYDEGSKGFDEDMEAGGHYMGYYEDAKELLKRTGMFPHLKIVSKWIEHEFAETNGQFFICGEGGEKNEANLPKYLYICPAFGLDWFQVYERTDKTSGPEW